MNRNQASFMEADTDSATDTRATLLEGEAFFANGKNAEAIECFRKVLSLDPCNPQALNDLGVAAFQLGALDMAEGFFIKALRLNRRDRDAVQNLAELYRARDPQARAEMLLQVHAGVKALRPAPCSRVLTSKRVLVINNLFPPQELGGYGRVMADYVDLLRARGHQVHVLTSDTRSLGEPGAERGVERSLQLFGEWSGKGMVEYDREVILRVIRGNDSVIREILERFHPELCLVGNVDLLSALIFQPIFQRNVPVLHRLGNEFIGYPVPDTPVNPLYHVATPSRWLREDAVRRGYPFQEAFLIHSGAFVRGFEMVFPPATDRLRIAFAGLVNPYKGPQVLIKALGILDRNGMDFSCSIAGSTLDPRFVAELKQVLRDMNLEGKVQFTGHLDREELKDLYARHNVLVFPSLVNETFGISQVEAMAAGLLVITSGKGGAREVVEHGVSGLVFDPGDHGRLAGLLMDLARDPHRWEKLAEKGRRRSMEEFDIEHSVDRMEEAFQKMLNHSSQGRRQGSDD